MVIGGAYLRAHMKKEVLVLINKEETRILLKLYPELAQYCDENRRLTAQAMKALYGCIESGKLWYDTLSSKLLANGYNRIHTTSAYTISGMTQKEYRARLVYISMTVLYHVQYLRFWSQ